MFDSTSNSGVCRVEAAVVILIQWYIALGGFDSLEKSADITNFEKLPWKKDDEVGKLVMAEHPFLMMNFIQMVHQNEAMLRVWTLILPNPDDKVCVENVHRILNWRFEAAIGHALFDGGWWSRNEKRVKKAQKAYQSVVHVMES